MARKIGMMLAIKSADFLPRRLPAQPDNVREMLLGRLIGEATGLKLVPAQDDPTRIMEGLKGAFQFTDAQDPTRVLQAPVLWAPDMIAAPVKDLLREDEDGVVKATKVELAFDIYAIRSPAPLGYTWKAEAVFEPEANPDVDPIARIAQRAAAIALPAPTRTDDAPAETETAKEPVAAKGKGK